MAEAAESTKTTDTPKILAAFRTAERVPFGRKLFSQGFRFAAPYFRTIPATIDSAEPGIVTGHMLHTPWVRNHLGTVHAIALCNLAELTMGVVAESTIPRTHRWIPKGMTVEYLAKAQGTMHAIARLDLPDPLGDQGQELPVKISVTDPHGTEVFTASIRIWVTRKPTA